MPVPRRLLSTGGSNRAKEWLKHHLSFRFLVWKGDFPGGPSPGLPCLLPAFYFTCPAVWSPTCSQNLLHERRVLQVTPVQTTLSACSWMAQQLASPGLAPPHPLFQQLPFLCFPAAAQPSPGPECMALPARPLLPVAQHTVLVSELLQTGPPAGMLRWRPGGGGGKHLSTWPGCLAAQQVQSSQQAPFPGC